MQHGYLDLYEIVYAIQEQIPSEAQAKQTNKKNIG